MDKELKKVPPLEGPTPQAIIARKPTRLTPLPPSTYRASPGLANEANKDRSKYLEQDVKIIGELKDVQL